MKRGVPVGLANALRSGLRVFTRGRFAERVAAWGTLAAALTFAWAEGIGLAAGLRLSRVALAGLPALRPEYLLSRLFQGGFTAAAVLLVLGTLTTAVSTLFLSDELPLRITLPIPHRHLLARQLAITIGAAAAPALLLSLPAIAVASAAAPRPMLAAAAIGTALLAIVLLAGSLGSVLALLLVQLVSPVRARLLAAFLSAAGLAVALIGFRTSRPERLLDPIAALLLLEGLGKEPPAPSAWNPAAWAADASVRALFGHPSGLAAAIALALGGLVVLALASRLLAALHFDVWQKTRGAGSDRRALARPREARSLGGALILAECRTLFRDASTPAQLGSLAAVFVLDLLNVRLLPSSDPAARDLVTGLQAGLALFLVSALSLRFAYPSVSSDGRSALLLRSFPLSPARHLAARYAVRGLPAVLVALVLIGLSDAALRPLPDALLASLAVGLLGALALPALNLGLGALFPRYAAPNAIAVALGPGGLMAMTLSTALSLAATLVVSAELRGLVATSLRVTLTGPVLLAGWTLAALALAAVPLALAARSLGRSDVAAG